MTLRPLLASLVALLVICGLDRHATAQQQPLPSASRTPTVAPMDEAFARAVDLRPLDEVAVWTNGRLKSFESFAREIMNHITGGKEVLGHPNAYTYFDLMLRNNAYGDVPYVHVKMKLMRVQMTEALRASFQTTIEPMRAAAQQNNDQPTLQSLIMLEQELEHRLDEFEKSGLISPQMLADPRVQGLLETLRSDLIRTASKVDAINTALSLGDPRVLRRMLAIIAPAGGDRSAPWLTPDDLLNAHMSRELTPAENEAIAAWADFAAAWRSNNATQVNAAAIRLAKILPTIHADLYPSTKQLSVESWYFRAKNMTWVWLFYAVALVPLLLFVAFRWRGALIVGMGLYTIALLLQTASIALRWYVSGRWPNTNMFEAVTTASWFGVVFAILLEAFILRKSALRGLVALGGAAAGMVALMAAYYMPAYLNPHISNAMPVLHDVWLYIHTNVIIFSYCLIFMAAVAALLYLVHRVLLRVTSPAQLDVSTQYARVGGAGSLILTRPDGSSHFQPGKASLGQVLDGTTMILMELSFVLLWAGLVMGAIWADHSWGRPWGWDPKEVFALNTFIVFAILIHARMKVRDKGLWTAWIAIIGCLVMLFNWIIINFTIAGLHSYAGS